MLRETPHPPPMLRISGTLSHKGRGCTEFVETARNKLTAQLVYATKKDASECDERATQFTPARRDPPR
ncbi:hypothetical protein BRAS3809_6330001 [Bradyrhizobium sp. STM 3809]|nr:hypothetical protein BRAS3809_6330001 [Bradyrhizobium sp. STM 3809]